MTNINPTQSTQPIVPSAVRAPDSKQRSNAVAVASAQDAQLPSVKANEQAPQTAATCTLPSGNALPVKTAALGAMPNVPASPSTNAVRDTAAALRSVTRAGFTKPWADVRDTLDAAIPESRYMWGPAAESAESAGGTPKPNSHSQALYAEFWSEADRSWGGLQCMHAAFAGTDEAYNWLTQNQDHPLKLTRAGFDALHKELTEATPDDAHLQALVWAVLCNDLGKTKKLANLYRELMKKTPPDHDRLLGELLEAHPAYFPAFASLDGEERSALIRTFKCGCDIAQFLQLEVAPEEVKALGELSAQERHLYVLHSKYDVMGALSNFNPDGTIVYTESTHESFLAVETALAAFDAGKNYDQVYDSYIEERGRLIGLTPPLTSKARLTAIVAAMTRVTRSSGRPAIEMVLDDPKNKATVDVLLENIGTMHVYYGPALLLNPGLTLGKQPQPANASTTPLVYQVDERFDPTFAFKMFCEARPDETSADAEEDWEKARPKVEGLWMGLTSLAQAFTNMADTDSRAVGRIPGTSVRQLDVGDIARAMSRPAMIQPGRPLPATRLSAANMGATAGIIKPEVVKSMTQLAADVIFQLRLPDVVKAQLARSLRTLPESTQDLLSEVFQLANANTWVGGADLHQAMVSEGAKIGLSADESAKRFLITLAQIAYSLEDLPKAKDLQSGRTLERKLDLGALSSSAAVCLRGGVLHLAQEVGSTNYVPGITAVKGVDVTRFARMESLAQLPGKKVLCVGIGGADGAQAAQIALQLKAAGKEIAGVVSVRGIFTGSPSRADKGLVVARTIDHHDGELEPGLGVFTVNKDTSGTGRMYENVMADDLSVRVLVESIDRDVSQQVKKLLDAEGGVDTVVVVNTSGRILDLDNAPEPRVMRAIESLPGVQTFRAVVPLLTDNESFEKAALDAEAQFHPFTDDEASRMLATYRDWGMDGSDEHLYSNGAFTLQAALTTQNFEGPAAFPYASWLVQHHEQRRNPYKALNPAMAGVFIMPGKSPAIASREVRWPSVNDLLGKLRAAYPKYTLAQLHRMYAGLHQADRQALQGPFEAAENKRAINVIGLDELLPAVGSAKLALSTLAQLYRGVVARSGSKTPGQSTTVDVSGLTNDFDPDAHIAIEGDGEEFVATWSMD